VETRKNEASKFHGSPIRKYLQQSRRTDCFSETYVYFRIVTLWSVRVNKIMVIHSAWSKVSRLTDLIVMVETSHGRTARVKVPDQFADRLVPGWGRKQPSDVQHEASSDEEVFAILTAKR